MKPQDDKARSITIKAELEITQLVSGTKGIGTRSDQVHSNPLYLSHPPAHAADL